MQYQHITLDAAFRALAPAMPANHPKSFHAFGITHHFTAAQGSVVLVILAVMILGGVVLAALRGNS